MSKTQIHEIVVEAHISLYPTILRIWLGDTTASCERYWRQYGNTTGFEHRFAPALAVRKVLGKFFL